VVRLHVCVNICQRTRVLAGQPAPSSCHSGHRCPMLHDDGGQGGRAARVAGRPGWPGGQAARRPGGRARGARKLEPATKEIIMATSALPGNGERVLVHGEHEAIIVEAGAGVRSYTLDALPVVAGYPPEAVCPSGRWRRLEPWPNRVPRRRASTGATAYELPR